MLDVWLQLSESFFIVFLTWDVFLIIVSAPTENKVEEKKKNYKEGGKSQTDKSNNREKRGKERFSRMSADFRRDNTNSWSEMC